MPDVASQVLEIAIAIAFIYFVLSVIASGIAELIAVMLRLRAKTLVTGLRDLLGGEKADALFNHPLVARAAAGKRKAPSYLSPRNFSLALIDTVAPPPQGTPGSRNVLAAVAESVGTLPEPLKQQLTPLLEEAEGDITRFRNSVEKWFDDSMSRVSGWYRRRSQLIVFGIAAVVTVGFNVDTLRITDRLWDDSALRESVVAAAIEVVEENAAAATDASAPADAPSATDEAGADASAVADAPAATDEVGTEADADTTDAGATLGDVGAAVEETEASLDELDALQLPIGWNDANDDWTNVPTIVGWLVTFFAISLGAPFWFDALNRLARLRGTGPVPDRADAPSAR